MKLHEISPILWTNDLEATGLFYTGVLGFKGESNFPNFIALERNDTRIMFVVPQGVDFSEAKLTGSIYCFVDNADELWSQVKDKARIKEPIADRAYMMRDFAIFDNNGYEIVFGHDISQSQGNNDEQ